MAKQTGIKKLSNGRFRARYFAGLDHAGKRQYPAKTFDTQGDAIRWRAERVGSKSPGQRIEGHSLTVGQFLDEWLAIKKQDLRENSLQAYRQSLDLYVRPALGHIRLTRLTPRHVQAMVTDLLTRVSASTASTARVLLNGAMKRAVRLELIRANPVTNTDGPARVKPVLYPLTVAEARRLLDACEGARFGLLFEAALITGLRPEELIGLQWANVELARSRGILRVRKVIHDLKGGGWRGHDPKTKSGIRSIMFDAELTAKLEAHRKQQLEQKFSVGKSWKNNDLVFCNGIGEPIRQRALRYVFKLLLASAKLPATIRLYDCRHFFVTSSLIAGVDAKTVSQEAGHSKVSFTLDTYGHVLEEMHETASEKRAELMKRRGGK